jgi:PIN domain nuclease of toxin-antitoxin system
MADVILDASAVLARVLGEPGGERVETCLPDARVCAINYCEVVSKLVELGMPIESVAEVARDLELTVEPFEEADATTAGLLRAATRHLGLSLGDRACLALAQRLQLPVLTADRAWAQLDLGVEVVLIR